MDQITTKIHSFLHYNIELNVIYIGCSTCTKNNKSIGKYQIQFLKNKFLYVDKQCPEYLRVEHCIKESYHCFICYELFLYKKEIETIMSIIRLGGINESMYEMIMNYIKECRNSP